MTFAAPQSAWPFIRVQWLPRENDLGAPFEQATAAEIAIRLRDGRNLTKIEDSFAQTVRETARLSAYDLALWFAANWWRLRWEPTNDTQGWRMSHHLAAAGGGFVWPDIVFDGDGRDMRIVARPTTGEAYHAITYLTGGRGLVEAATFESDIDRFLETTVARLCATGHEAAPLVALWREVQEERCDPATAAYRRLEAMAGFDADEGPPPLFEELLALEQEWGVAAVEEIAAASHEHAVADLRALLEQARPQAITISVPAAVPISVWDRLQSGDEPAWSAGYRLAELVRDTYGLGIQPVSADKLMRLFDVPGKATEVHVETHPIAAAFRSGAGAAEIGIFLKARSPRAKRFELMRLIGGHLATRSNDRLVPATKAKTARQKLQRAFAAEFLCPIAGLQELFGQRAPDADDIDEAAERYDVSPLVVSWMLHNRGKAPESSMRF